VPSGGAGFVGLRLCLEDAESELGCVEDMVALFRGDCVDEDSVGGAGDEFAEALVAGDDGHGLAIGFAGGDARPGERVFVVGIGELHEGLIGAMPCGEAAADGGFCGFGIARGQGTRDDGEGWGWVAFGSAEIGAECFGHCKFSSRNSVRRKGVIICKRGGAASSL